MNELAPTVAAIRYVIGDASDPPTIDAPALLVHICNAAGGWGRGFTGALSQRFPEPERAYRAWFRGHEPNAVEFALGQTQFVRVKPHLVVANMLAQTTFRPLPGNASKLVLPALGQCLTRVAEVAIGMRASVHAPRLGCGLAGGTWDQIQPLIEQHLLTRGVAVTIYDLPTSA